MVSLAKRNILATAGFAIFFFAALYSSIVTACERSCQDRKNEDVCSCLALDVLAKGTAVVVVLSVGFGLFIRFSPISRPVSYFGRQGSLLCFIFLECTLIVAVTTAVRSNQDTEWWHGAPFLILLAVATVHLILQTTGRIYSEFYRSTFVLAYICTATSSIILFFVSPLLAMLITHPTALSVTGPFFAAILLSFFGTRQQKTSPRPLLEWEVVTIDMPKLILQRPGCGGLAVDHGDAVLSPAPQRPATYRRRIFGTASRLAAVVGRKYKKKVALSPCNDRDFSHGTSNEAMIADTSTSSGSDTDAIVKSDSEVNPTQTQHRIVPVKLSWSSTKPSHIVPRDEVPRRLWSNDDFRLNVTDIPTTSERSEQPLRIVQITDPHLGCMYTPERLHTLCSMIVDTVKPDFVFLTGDFFTCESNNEPEALSRGLSPLTRMNYLDAINDSRDEHDETISKEKRHNPRVFACYGNHDLESESVKKQTIAGVKSCGAVLLDDERLVVPSRIGPVEIIGLTYYKKQAEVKRNMVSFFSKRQRELVEEEKIDKDKEHKRPIIAMLHDPMAFVHLPPTLGALVLSGHTHGGHFGLYSLHRSLQHATLIRALGHFDNGTWTARSNVPTMKQQSEDQDKRGGTEPIVNTNVLYVHRGQGSRGMLSNSFIRLGVPSEDSVLHVYP